MNKVTYIIPGFTDSNKQTAYKKIAGYFKSKGIRPIPIDISWKYKTMSDYLEEFNYKYKGGKEVYLLGFSLGAMIAMISSAKINPKMQILCSLSPYFKEDLPPLREWWKQHVGKRRMDDFNNYSFNEISSKTNCKTILLVGSKEPRDVLKRVNNAHKRLKDSRLVTIENIGHDINHNKYQDALEDIISKLN